MLTVETSEIVKKDDFRPFSERIEQGKKLMDKGKRVVWELAELAFKVHEERNSGEHEGSDNYKESFEQWCDLIGLDVIYALHLIQGYNIMKKTIGTGSNRKLLTTEHYRAVSTMGDEEAKEWLHKAEENNWGKDRLRKEIKKVRDPLTINQKEEQLKKDLLERDNMFTYQELYQKLNLYAAKEPKDSIRKEIIKAQLIIDNLLKKFEYYKKEFHKDRDAKHV